LGSATAGPEADAADPLDDAAALAGDLRSLVRGAVSTIDVPASEIVEDRGATHRADRESCLNGTSAPSRNALNACGLYNRVTSGHAAMLSKPSQIDTGARD